MSSSICQIEELLGELAMEFRSTRNVTEKKDVAAKYARTVAQLIESNKWDEVPAPEDQLPNAWMPREFFEYRSRRFAGT